MSSEKKDVQISIHHTMSVPRVVDIRDLLLGEKEIIILHDGERYRLRITANKKLLLTK